MSLLSEATSAHRNFAGVNGCQDHEEMAYPAPDAGMQAGSEAGGKPGSGAAIIRSVARAVELLQALNRRPVSTIDFLHLQTGLPKPSIVRMMQTLEGCGLVKHAPQYGAYYLTSGVLSLSHGFHSEPMVVEAAASLLDALTMRIKWPVAIAILEDFSMVVRYSTIPLSPLALRHSTLNFSLSLVSRAIGRAYLAFCSHEQQHALLNALAESASPEDERAGDRVSIQHVLDDVQTKGFATRDPGVWPASNTLAVPVFDNHGVACSMGLTYFSSAMKPAQAVERHLAELQDVAHQIGERLKALQSSTVHLNSGSKTRFRCQPPSARTVARSKGPRIPQGEEFRNPS